MCTELKIKAKHLALEPGIIRKEENKLRKQMKYNRGEPGYFALENKRDSLCNHRRWNVRNESRATGLARAYLAGKAYITVEKKRNEDVMFQMYIVPRIVAMVTKYGKGDQRRIDRTHIKEWSKL